MAYDSLEVNNLINSDKLEEALAILQKHFIESERIPSEDMEYINTIITNALSKDNVTLAIKAAVNRVGSWYTKPIPESASWSAIMSKAKPNCSFEDLDFPCRLLVPKESTYMPETLNKMAVDLWHNLKESKWSLPGVKVIFNAYGWRPLKKDKGLLFIKVEAIKGDDFYMGFSGDQGKTVEESRFIENGGFSFIAVPNFYMNFYSDGSGPSVYKYHGNDWKGQIAHIIDPCFSGYGMTDWKEINCKTPGKDSIYPQYVLFKPSDQEAIMSEHRTKGLSTKEGLIQEAAKALQASLDSIYKQPEQSSSNRI